ncbi:MAG: acyltransferase [Candidatus Margulisiibacteriota bacterium]
MGWLTQDQIQNMGFASVGNPVWLSDKASYYGTQNIRIGSHVRIDDFCVLSAGQGGIDIGHYVHIAVYTSLIGAAPITLGNFVSISSKVAIYSSSDDYSGKAMTNPMVPTTFTQVNHAPVVLEKHVILGSGTVVLPGVTLKTGASVGALSLVTQNCKEFVSYLGSPARPVGHREQTLLDLEQQFLDSLPHHEKTSLFSL